MSAVFTAHLVAYILRNFHRGARTNLFPHRKFGGIVLTCSVYFGSKRYLHHIHFIYSVYDVDGSSF